MSTLLTHGFLFVLALVLSGLFPERMRTVHTAIIRDPVTSGGLGLGALILGSVAAVLLTLSVLGIPVVIAGVLALPLVFAVGLSAMAHVIGAALPFPELGHSPFLRPLAGVGVLFGLSLVPVLGTLTLAVIATVGVGAVVRTRFREELPESLPTGTGPYRLA